MSLRSKIRQSLWLETINQSLYMRVPGRRRREIMRELRANLVAATDEIGPEEALRRLGNSRSLVEGYLETDRSRFDLGNAIIAALATLLVSCMVGMLVAYVAFETHDAMVNPGALNHTYFGLWTVSAGAGGLSLEWNALWMFVLAIVAFVIAGRAWRLLPRSRPAE